MDDKNVNNQEPHGDGFNSLNNTYINDNMTANPYSASTNNFNTTQNEDSDDNNFKIRNPILSRSLPIQDKSESDFQGTTDDDGENDIEKSINSAYNENYINQDSSSNIQIDNAQLNNYNQATNDSSQISNYNNDYIQANNPNKQTDSSFIQSSNYNNQNDDEYNQSSTNANQFNDTTNNFENNNYDSNDYNIQFVQNWMGKLYDKAHSKKFNWSSALFGGAYFLYRKMYSTAVLIIVFTILMSVLSVFLMIKSVIIGALFSLLFPLVLAISLGFGFYPLYRNFVRSKLNKYKKTITNNDQLISIARKNGGTSTLSVILYFVLMPIIISSITGALISAGIISIKVIPFGSKENTTTQNETLEPKVDMQDFNFDSSYLLAYDANTWFLDDSSKSLVKGDYKLVYSNQSIQNVSTTFNQDSKTATGRSGILQSITSSFSAQAASANLQLESGSSNFILQDNCYYAYVDVIEASTINRYYLILLPEKDILFQFVLTINDTSIDYKTNLSVISMLSSINFVTEDNSQASANTTNTLSNTIIDNSVDSILSNSTSVGNTNSSNISTNSNAVNTNSFSNTSSNNTSSNLNSILVQ